MNLSNNCKKLLQASCADATWKQYESVMNQFNEFCKSKGQDDTKPSLSIILDFLSDLFERGASYASVNTARSALSTIIGHVDGVAIGSHNLVTRLLKGVARLRPPTYKYKSTWDTSEILLYLESLGSNDNLILRTHSKKLAALMALCSGQRVQTLSSINLDEIKFYEDRVIINVKARLKTSKPGIPTCIEFPVYSDVRLCVFNCLKSYIDKTEKLRDSLNLFIQTRKPFKKATTQTISKWLKETLNEAGININEFSSHSFRHASTSKAAHLGVSIDSIYKCAGWTDKSKIFAMFYKRPIMKQNSFASAILSNSQSDDP